MTRRQTAKNFNQRTVLVCMAFALTLPVAAFPPAGKQDMLAEIDLDEAAVEGKWSRGGGGDVRCAEGATAKLRLGDAPAGEYTLAIEFTRTAGKGGVGIVLAYDDANFAWVVGDDRAEANGFRSNGNGDGGDSGGSSSGNGNSKGPKRNRGASASADIPRIQNGQKYRVFINVSEAFLEAKIGGKVIGKRMQRPDYSSFGLDESIAVADGAIGVVSLGSAVTIHSAVLTPKRQPAQDDGDAQRGDPREKPPRQPPKKEPAKPAGVELASPSQWSGTRSHNRGTPANCQIRVNQRNGDIYQLVYCEHHCQRKIAMTFKLTARGELILQGWKNQSVADLTIQNFQARGSTNGEGMQIGYSWVESGRRHQNAVVQGSIDVTRD